MEELRLENILRAIVLFEIARLIRHPLMAIGLVERALVINRRLYSVDNGYTSDCLRLLAELNSELGNVDF